MPEKTLTSSFRFKLPKELIAQEPTKPRDHARLLILDKKNQKLQHDVFKNIGTYLNKGDVIVLNDSKVIPARLIGRKKTGGRVEIFLLHKLKPQTWEVLIGGKIKENEILYFGQKVTCTVISKQEMNVVKFNASDAELFKLGETPVPPYIKTQAKLENYQTVYAKKPGSVAAPTAGLHFTNRLIAKLKTQGIKFEHLTLHVGQGTFQPVKAKYLQDHLMHSEYASVSQKTARVINQAKRKGNRIIACGTTSARTLEALTKNYELQATSQWVNIFIYPGYQFQLIDGLITNFHLPESTLIMLVSALATKKLTLQAYQEAIKQHYHFYSFGDAMLII